MRVLVEVCATTIEQVKVAAGHGVDHVELCTWLSSGGVTPSVGMVHQAIAVGLPVRILLRASPGPFVPDADERATMLADAALLHGHVQGIVSGGLLSDGSVDASFVRELCAAAPRVAFTFHRAIDHARDPLEALDRCLDLGVHRVLTSGAAPSAAQGMRWLDRFVQHAAGRIVIAAAAGIGPRNVVEIVERTGVDEVHFSLQYTQHRQGHDGMGLHPGCDVAKLDGVLNALVKAGLR